MDDQVRECRAWADKNGYSVPEEFVFIDRARRGGSNRRAGLEALRQVIAAKQVDVIIVFATSRLFRRSYRALQFVHEEIVERDMRCVFVHSGIDTANLDDWEMRLHVQSLVDELQTKNTKAHIRAAHIGLLLNGRVFGTIPFGYRGEVKAGESTRSGKPARRLAVDPAMADWVRRAFAWAVNERLSLMAIARRLNELGAPLPPRCATGRWTHLAVKIMLTNPRYIGRWQYGRTEAKWISTKDYVRQVDRDEPLRVEQRDDLRIIDDETWHRAQELIGSNPHAAGRKPLDGDRRRRPKLLNGTLYCGYHNRPLIVGGGNGTYYICPACRDGAERMLFTHVNRRLASELICAKLADLIRGDRALVDAIVTACRTASEAQQRPDPGAAARLQQQCRRISEQIEYVMGMLPETSEDRRENQAKVAELRRQRAGLEAELARLNAAAAKPIAVPGPTEIEEMLAQLSVELAALGNDTESEVNHARQIIELITGGKILIYQAGPRRPHEGWAKAVFCANVVRLGAQAYGAGQAAGEAVEISLDIRKSPPHEQIADRAKELWDQALTYVEIGKRLGCGHNLVTRALKFWHERQGLPAPDGRKFPKRLRRPKAAERTADEVMQLIGLFSIQDIAARLGVSRNRVAEGIRIWHERRGLPVPDGRRLRRVRNEKRHESM